MAIGQKDIVCYLKPSKSQYFAFALPTEYTKSKSVTQLNVTQNREGQI